MRLDKLATSSITRGNSTMKELDLLPPSSHGQLTALALVVVVGSLLFCITLLYLKWIYPAKMYLGFVTLGFSCEMKVSGPMTQ